MHYLFYIKEIEKVSNKEAIYLPLLYFSLSLLYDSDCQLLLHKTILAEIRVIFALSLLLGIL